MDIPILKDITVIFAFATASLLLCSRLKVPGILGYIVTGLLVGPNGLGLIAELHSVDIMAEIGVVLLLFTIGLEFSLQQLIVLKRVAVGGGLLQVVLTILIVTAICMIFNLHAGLAIFYGLLVALSSTAIVLKLLMERGEIEAPFGKVTTGILIFQDIAVIPMMLITPMLVPGGDTSITEIFYTLGKALVIVVALFVGARFVVPTLLLQVTKTRSRELFLFSIVLICMAVAFVTNKAGLSLALGAFLAGMVVSETGYGYQALGNVVPFKDVFTGFFFVSVGMLIDINVFLLNPLVLIVVALGIIFIKATIASMVINIVGYPIHTSVRSGLSIAQVGEFSFILAATGALSGILTKDQHSQFIAVSVLTMIATPFLIQYSHKISELAKKLPLPKTIIKGYLYEIATKAKQLNDHIIVVGFGLSGRNIVEAANVAGIDYNVIEMNPSTVQSEKIKGTHIFYGDASQEEVLHHAKIENARSLVIAGADARATKNIVETAHRLNPSLVIIARTRFSVEAASLKQLGASEVIVEEIESSVAILHSVLRRYFIPLDEIEKYETSIRRVEKTALRRNKSRDKAASLGIKGVGVESITVPVNSTIVDKTLRDIDARYRYQVNVIAITSGGVLNVSPKADYHLKERDELLVTGKHQDIALFATIFNNYKIENE